MSINHTILGLLSVEPLTGYDLKKIIQDSPFMYWSGNNNQIYKSLLELSNRGYVKSQVKHQEKSPSKKIYTITEDGLVELKKWLKLEPETPQLKKAFLVQLAWSQQLSSSEILELLDTYEKDIRGCIAIEEEKQKRGRYAPDRTDRETAIWNLIYDNVISSYSAEIDWVKKVRKTIEASTD